MLMKMLGGLDILAGILLFFISKFNFPWQVLFVLGVLFIVKAGLGMWQDFASWSDSLVAVCFLISILINLPLFILVIAGALVIQKGLFSLL